jgi:excisionase family DNA binding protein
MITRCDGDRKDEQEDYGRSTGGHGATLDSMTTRLARGQDRDRGPLLTVAQAGEYLGTGERFIRRLITERRIGYVKVGKYVRLERATLDAFVDTGRVHSQR